MDHKKKKKVKPVKEKKVKQTEGLENKSFETKGLIGKIIIGIGIIISIMYIGYAVIFCGNDANQLSIIINSLVISVAITFISMAVVASDVERRKTFAAVSTGVLVFFVLLQIGVHLNFVKIPTQPALVDFTNMSVIEALDYAKSNNISVEQVYEYSEDIDEFHIIRQSVSASTLIKNIESLKLYVSNGPNPEQEVILSNMVGWNVDDVVEVIEKNYLTNVNMDFVINDEIDKDTIISQNLSGAMKRNTRLEFVASLGSESELEPVAMIVLTDYTTFKSTLWLKRHGIKYEIVYEFSDSIKRGNVIKTDKEAGVMIDPKKDTVVLTISKGEKIVVPDLTKMTSDEIINWVITNKLKIDFKEVFNSSVDAGKVISVNYKENNEIEEGTLIEVVLSKGTLTLKEFSSLAEFRIWATNNSVLYKEEYEFNDSVAKGNIIKFSLPTGSVINSETEIIVYISDGKAVTVPNFYGMNKSSITSKCNSIGLKCTFYTGSYSDSVAEGLALSQNKKANSQVSSGTNVSIGLSKGKAPSGGGTTPTPDPGPSCTGDTLYTLVIQDSWIGTTADATISNLRSKLAAKYPKITFTFEKRDGFDPSGFIHASSPTTDGTTIKDCNTYKIIVNN